MLVWTPGQESRSCGYKKAKEDPGRSEKFIRMMNLLPGRQGLENHYPIAMEDRICPQPILNHMETEKHGVEVKKVTVTSEKQIFITKLD